MPMDMTYKGKTVDDYLKAVSPKHRKLLKGIRKIIKEEARGSVEAISYGMPGYKIAGRPLVYFASFKDHCSFFTASGTLVKKHEAQLKGFKTSKGTIQFTAEKPLPDSLVRKLVKERVLENFSRLR